MQSTEQKLREALQKAKEALSLALSDVDWRKGSPTQPVIYKAYNCVDEALALPNDDVKSILQDALNVLGCLEYGITGVDSWPCEDSVENVVHRIRKVLEESQ